MNSRIDVSKMDAEQSGRTCHLCGAAAAYEVQTVDGGGNYCYRCTPYYVVAKDFPKT